MTRYFVTVAALDHKGGHDYSYHTGIAAFEHELPTDEEIRMFCTAVAKCLRRDSCMPVMMQRLHDEEDSK